MTDGDIHNRQSRINNTVKSLKEDERVSEHDLEVILDFKNYLESQNLSLDRISRYFYSLKFIVRHINWDLDQPDKEKLVGLVRDINQDELWDGERADSTKCEYKKLVRKLYKDYLDDKREDIDGGELTGFFTVTTKKSYADPSDLSIRHIGGIYEGLLEYNLELAEEHMVTVKRSGNQKWEKKSETDRKNFYDEAEEGEIYLVTDEGDRKVTGSYYTPDYIVKRMVEDSLEPKVQEKLNQVSDELGGEEERKKKKEAILSINVCDPAMGSGHFLVEATEFLAQHLTPYIHEEEEENDIDIAKREIVKNCIYGVDVNDLATELSKVSLWLNTISENKPLSFLDHHLKTGNSLLNANLENLDEHPEKKDEKEEQEGRNEGLWAFTDSDKSKIEEEISEMVDKFEEIQTQEESSREDIQKEENLYNEFKDSEFREKVKLLLDTYLSYWFGNEYSEEEYDEIVKSIELDNGDIDFISEEEKVKKAKDVSKKRDFFHWEIEFPDVFLELGQNGNSSGFDIVIGNPPYVSNWSLSDSDSEMVDALEKIYPDVTTGHWDLFVPFVKQSLDLTSEDGRHTFILPTSFGMEKYGRKVREHILDNHYLENLTEFGEFKAFGQEVDRLFMTYLIQKNERSGETEIWKYDTEHGFDKKGVISQSKFSRLPNNTLRTDVTDLDFQIKDKVDDISIKLGNICVVNVGVVAHSSSDSELDFKKNDVIHSEQKAGFEKYVEGSDISRYQINWGGEYLDYDDKREHFHRPKYPELFTPEKLLISRVSSEGGRISSCLDSEGYYTNDNTIIAKIWSKDVLEQQKPKEDWYVDDRKKEYDHSFISGLVNSSLLTYIFTKFFATDTLQGSYSGIYPEDARNLPLLLEVDEETKEEISETVSRITELNSEIADESSGFLRWIEREWGTDIEKLSRKTYLKKFWKHGFDDDRKSILKIAKHNSSELEIDPSSLDFQEQLENEWSDKVETLREKEEKIEKLDIGLDALVLEAYGLSEREARKTLEAMTFSEDKKEKIIKIKEKMENEDTLEVLE